MTLEQIEKAIEQRGGRLKARYRDQWGFIVNGVILGTDNGEILIDNLKNRVKPDQVVAINHI